MTGRPSRPRPSGDPVVRSRRGTRYPSWRAKPVRRDGYAGVQPSARARGGREERTEEVIVATGMSSSRRNNPM
ncbi:hypothetical protein ABZZ37_07960 [Streptomyces sp. NPDC006464]|uniref:hypothetical protein n=1 Tax=Streptomyces sp. NPDC006464 TaxID=3154305 RepID=UPI0033A4B8FE